MVMMDLLLYKETGQEVKSESLLENLGVLGAPIIQGNWPGSEIESLQVLLLIISGKPHK
jgi:hypothetical protein